MVEKIFCIKYHNIIRNESNKCIEESRITQKKKQLQTVFRLFIRRIHQKKENNILYLKHICTKTRESNMKFQ